MSGRKLHKQPVGPFAPRNHGLQAGDRVWQRVSGDDESVRMIDLFESRGRDKAASGELSYRVVVKRGKERRAYMDDRGVWYWCE